jgi:diacylglycerol O-acyltransferase
VRRLSGTDTLMLYSENAKAQNIIAPVAIYDASGVPGGRIGLDEVLRFVESRLHISETFREKLVRVPFGLGNPYWIKDPDFDLEYHVRHIALPRPGTWEQFTAQVSRIGQRPLDLDRPPWELYLIEGLDAVPGVPPGGFAILLKLHHAAVDGVAGTEILNALHDHSPGPGSLVHQVDDDWRPDVRPSDLELVARAAAHAVVDPFGTARRLLLPTVRSLPRTTVRTLRSSEARSQTVAPVAATRFNRPVGPHRVWDAHRALLDEAKRIRKAVPGASINDVALAWIGGALRTYLDKHGELPDNPLVALMPISLRPTSTQRAAGTEVEAARGGNRFAMANIPMGTDIEDPLERIAAIMARTQTAKEYALDAPSLVEWSEALPGAIAGTAQRAVIRLANRTGRTMGVHMIVTNVPGPQNPLYFDGARCLFTSGMAPVVDGMGIIHAVTSYQGQFVACFTADRDMMPDPAFYAGCIEQAFADLKEAAGVE